MNDKFTLPVPEGIPRQLARGWLLLGLAALIGSGIYSILLVLSRTPAIQEFIPWIDFFHTALVVHVDLSVVIWFLAFAGVLWSLNDNGRAPLLARLALALCITGTAVITFSPFAGAGNPLMNNYIPVLRHPLYFAGLALFAAGFALLVARSLFTQLGQVGTAQKTDALRAGIWLAIVSTALALAALLWSYAGIPGDMEGEAYFEYLFWGSGHVLQFTHTLLMLATWVWLAEATGSRIPLRQPLATLLFVLVFLPALGAVPIYLSAEIVSPDHRIGFTRLMEYGGLAALPLGLAVCLGLARKRAVQKPEQRPVRAALLASLLLFASGGILGFMIEGVNVVIPAHYHGSIVGVTLAFMGLTYHLLPRIGYRQPAVRISTIQPWVYGGGQMMHILGLAWSGGYGVQRKTAGAAQGLENLPEIAGMALMGLGGLVAIIGGILFLVATIAAIWRGRTDG